MREISESLDTNPKFFQKTLHMRIIYPLWVRQHLNVDLKSPHTTSPHSENYQANGALLDAYCKSHILFLKILESYVHLQQALICKGRVKIGLPNKSHIF